MTKRETRIHAVLLTAMLGAAGIAGGAHGAEKATGRVYHDENGNGQREGGERGITDVFVSNGREIVRTDQRGRYELPVEGDTAIFVIKPAGWMTPVDENGLPQFYYLHKPNGSPGLNHPGVEPTGPLPESIDFPLHRTEELERFRAIIFGDPQVRDQKEIDYLAHDILEELVGVEAAFGATLGDIVFNNLEDFDAINEAVGTLGLPWYNVLGNHDINFDAHNDRLSDETFERIYGPSTYSFNYGQVHFVVLDDVVYEGQEERGYHGGLTDRQLAFLKNDLSRVPKDRLVVLMMHIPLNQVKRVERVMEMLSDRPHQFSLSAHSHIQQHRFMGPGGRHHHFNQGTASGTWWKGSPNDLGIPHTMMRDGTPNGYSIITFDGPEYSVRYKVAGAPVDHQMNIHAPDSVAAGQTGGAEVLANVFAGSERSTVEMRIGDHGEWIEMEKVEVVDPYYRRLYEWDQKVAEAVDGSVPYRLNLNEPRQSSHIWRATLPADLPPGSHVIHVRTTDMFGQTHEGRRVIRVEEAGAESPRE